MKLDANMLRYLAKEDFRVLTAVEMGQKNHEIVPAQLIASISGLRHGGSYKVLRTLLRHKLIHHDASKYDGYRLTTLGYDYLALRALCSRGIISGVGRQIGVGKESDVYEVVDEEGRVLVMKFHRLGRTSFRAVKSKRDYLKHRQNYSWLYLSRLAALKEFAFMEALYEHGLPVPQAVDHNRHCVVMSMIDGYPLSQIRDIGDPENVFKQIVENMVHLAKLGLVHCDFNEFNIMVNEEEEITVIDFPQMVSTKHENASMLFERDVDCIIKFFDRKFGYSPKREVLGMLAYPTLEEIASEMDSNEEAKLDKQLAASGFRRNEVSGDIDCIEEDEEEDEEEEGGGNTEEDGHNGEHSSEHMQSDDDGLGKLSNDAGEISLAELDMKLEEDGHEGGEALGEMDGLVEFARGSAGDNHQGALVDDTSLQSDVVDQSARGKQGSNKSRKKGVASSKHKSNSNKDKSGRRHASVKHKIRQPKADFY